MGNVGHTSGNLNDVRAYPLADTATRLSDAGLIMPEYVINDCHIWWPDTLGEVGFLASATISPALITATIAAYDSVTAATTVLAAVNVRRPLTPYRSYAVTPIATGVGGWVAFGDIPSELEGVNTWLFSNHEAGRLVPRVAYSYPVFPVQSIGEDGNPKSLEGHVRLIAGNNLQIKEGYRYVGQEYRRCVVFGIAEDALPDAYDLFAGPCGKRPETENCDKEIIRTVNRIEPNCKGYLFLEVNDAKGIIEGKKDITDGAAGGGVALFTPVEYDDVCNPVADFEPLPPDLCDLRSSSSVSTKADSEPNIQSSSSSKQIHVTRYEFNSAAKLKDWSLFGDNDSSLHIGDWDPEGQAVRINNGSMILPGTTTQEERTIANNKYAWPADEIGEEVAIDAVYKISIDQFNEMNQVSDEDHFVNLVLSNALDSSNSSYRGFRMRISYRRVSETRVRVNSRIQYHDGTGWSKVSGSTVFETETAINSSSSSSGSDANFFHQPMFFSVQLSAANQYTIQWKPYGESLQNDSFDASANNGASGEYEAAKFFAFTWRTTGATLDTTVPILDLWLNSITITSSEINLQKCDENDWFSNGDRPLYKVKYDPDSGWSNDFGTTRAVNQLTRKPEVSLLTEQSIILKDNEVVYPRQYLEGTGAGHKYAILECEDSIVDSDDYIVSAYNVDHR